MEDARLQSHRTVVVDFSQLPVVSAISLLPNGLTNPYLRVLCPDIIAHAYATACVSDTEHLHTSFRSITFLHLLNVCSACPRIGCDGTLI